MKKFAALLLALVLCIPAFALADEAEYTTVTIGATPSPHVEILEAVEPQLEAVGIKLNIVTYTDYVQPNDALAAGDLDANYFQHKPYMDNFNQSKGTNLVSRWSPIHYEPMGHVRRARPLTIEAAARRREHRRAQRHHQRSARAAAAGDQRSASPCARAPA